MEHGDIVLRLLGPADENPAEAVHPAMGPLHHPAPRLVPRLLLHRLGFAPLRRDVCREAERPDRLAHLSVGIPLVQAQMLLVLGAGRSTGMLASVPSTNFMSGRLAPSTAKPTGMPSPSTNKL